MDVLAIASSGLRSAELRLFASAHNVANFATPAFRPLRATQTSVEQGGSVATLRQEPDPQRVSLAREFLEQTRAATQFTASLRAFAVGAEMRGSLINLLA